MGVMETLTLEFRADLSGVDAQFALLTASLNALSSEEAQALASWRGFLGALRSGASEAQGAGAAVAQGYAAGIRSGTGMVRAAALSVSTAAQFSGGTAQARSAGLNLSLGFAAGIRSGKSAAVAAAAAVAGAAVAKLRAALKIRSPSRVTQEIGGYFGEGLALGMVASLSGVAAASEALSRAAVGGVSLSMPAAEAPINAPWTRGPSVESGGVTRGDDVIVPIYLDTMKLGEATIKAVNTVTRATGKVLLEL